MGSATRDSAAAAQRIGLDAALRQLRARGQRITPARAAVLQTLAAGAEHLTAAEIVDRAAELDPGVHRATVYRALSTLCELEIVTHTHVAGSGTIYHLTAGSGVAHAHLQCSSCGTVIDLPADALADLSARVRTELGFELEPEHAALIGICADCRPA